MSVRRLTELLQPLVEELGYEFVGLEYSSGPKSSLLRIYIDQQDGVDLDDCTTVSHEVAGLLDVEDPISGQYSLEISSPGLDRPLFSAEQFGRFTGVEASVTLFAPENGRRKFTGKILSVQGETVSLEVEGETMALKFSNIAKARLVPDYDSLMASTGRKAG